MNLEYLAGFFDREGSFIAKIRPSDKYRLGFHPELAIDITQKHRTILDTIRDFSGVGKVYFNSTYNLYQFRIHKLKDIQKFVSLLKDRIIVKRRDMLLFSQCLQLMLNKRHLTDDGLNEIKSVISILHSRN